MPRCFTFGNANEKDLSSSEKLLTPEPETFSLMLIPEYRISKFSFALGVDGNSSSKRMPPPSGVPAEFDSDWPFAGIHAGTPFSIPAQTRRLYAAMLSFPILQNQTVIGAEPALLPE